MTLSAEGLSASLMALQNACQKQTYTNFGRYIGDAFAHLNSEVYSIFCCNQSAAVRLYQEKIRAVPAFEQLTKHIESRKECNRLHFSDFMAKVRVSHDLTSCWPH